MDLHTVIHKNLYGDSLANKPVLLLEAFNPRSGEKIGIRHYDPRSLGQILYSEFKINEFDFTVRKIHHDDHYIFNDCSMVRLHRYPFVFEYFVFEHLGETGLIPIESVNSQLWSSAERWAGYYRIYRMKLSVN